jgi:hypothetical protein
LALQDRKGKDTADDNEEGEKQLDTPDRNAGIQDGENVKTLHNKLPVSI